MELILASLLTCEYATGLVDQIYKQHTDTPKSELVQIVAESTEKGCFEDANADWRNGFYPPNPEDKPMAQVTYRGVKYDSEAYRQMVQEEAQKRNHDLMYRGIKVKRKFASKS